MDSIPQRDSCRQQRQSAGTVALIFRFTIPDLTQTVQEYRASARYGLLLYSVQPGLADEVPDRGT